MASKQSPLLSPLELAEAVRRLQARIEALESKLQHLDRALVAGDRDRFPHDPELSPFETHETLVRDVRDALRHLDNPRHLMKSPLQVYIKRACRLSGKERELQQALYEAIEAVRPARDEAERSRRELQHTLLRLTYLEKRPAKEVAHSLGMSERQYYREIKVAIWLVAQNLAESWQKPH